MFYTISQLVSQGIGVVTNILIRNALGPLYMGVWSALKVVLDYTQYSGLGITSAVYCEIPYLAGAGRLSEVDAIKNVSFTFNTIVSLVVGVVLYAGSFFVASRYEPYVVIGIRVVALIAILTFFYNLVVSVLRAQKKFIAISKVLAFNAILTLVFVYFLVSRYSLYGMYITIPAVLLVSSLFVVLSERMAFHIQFNTRVLARLMKVGLPLFFGGIIYTVYMTVDKVMIIKILGPEALGFYSLAILMTSVIESFPRLFNIVLFPRVQEKYGKDGSFANVIKYIEKPTKLVFFTGIVFLGYVYFMISGLVPILMPKYTQGIVAAKIVLCGFLIFVLSMSSESFIITIRKQIYQIPMFLAATLISFLLNLYFLKCGYGLVGVAVGTSLGYIAYFLMQTAFAMSHFWSKKKIFFFYMGIFLPYVYILLGLWGIEALFYGHAGVKVMVFQMGIYALLTVPLFLSPMGRAALNEVKDLLNQPGR